MQVMLNMAFLAACPPREKVCIEMSSPFALGLCVFNLVRAFLSSHPPKVHWSSFAYSTREIHFRASDPALSRDLLRCPSLRWRELLSKSSRPGQSPCA